MKITILLVLSLFFAACGNNKNKKTKEKENSLAGYMELGRIHVRLGEPQPGEWLYHHEEKGQAIDDYKKKKRVCPNDSLMKITILPLGDFSENEWELLKATADYATKFFMLDVVLSGSVTDKIVPKKSRRGTPPYDQLHTRFILDSILFPNIPDSSISYISLTNKDLYPRDDWNFVFGQAHLKKRIGVSSYFRYFDEKIDSNNFEQVLKRTIKTTTHELCHMFSIKHCRIYKCLLNGSNHIMESDSRPLWLCPECLAKLQYCLQFDNHERFNNLIDFFNSYKWDKEAAYYNKAKTLVKEKS